MARFGRSAVLFLGAGLLALVALAAFLLLDLAGGRGLEGSSLPAIQIGQAAHRAGTSTTSPPGQGPQNNGGTGGTADAAGPTSSAPGPADTSAGPAPTSPPVSSSSPTTTSASSTTTTTGARETVNGGVRTRTAGHPGQGLSTTTSGPGGRTRGMTGSSTTATGAR